MLPKWDPKLLHPPPDGGHQAIRAKLKLTELLSLQTHLPILSTSAPETCKLSERISHSFFKNKQKALGGVFSKRLLGYDQIGFRHTWLNLCLWSGLGKHDRRQEKRKQAAVCGVPSFVDPSSCLIVLQACGGQ